MLEELQTCHALGNTFLHLLRRCLTGMRPKQGFCKRRWLASCACPPDTLHLRHLGCKSTLRQPRTAGLAGISVLNQSLCLIPRLNLVTSERGSIIQASRVQDLRSLRPWIEGDSFWAEHVSLVLPHSRTVCAMDYAVHGFSELPRS